MMFKWMEWIACRSLAAQPSDCLIEFGHTRKKEKNKRIWMTWPQTIYIRNVYFHIHNTHIYHTLWRCELISICVRLNARWRSNLARLLCKKCINKVNLLPRRNENGKSTRWGRGQFAVAVRARKQHRKRKKTKIERKKTNDIQRNNKPQ